MHWMFCASFIEAFEGTPHLLTPSSIQGIHAIKHLKAAYTPAHANPTVHFICIPTASNF